MEDNRIHIDDLYREELGNYTEAPGAAVWQKLQDRLDKEQKPKRSPWLRWFGRGSAVLLLSVAIFFVAQSIINTNQNKTALNEPIAVTNTHAAPVNPSATGAAVTTPESETAPVNPTPTTVTTTSQPPAPAAHSTAVLTTANASTSKQPEAKPATTTTNSSIANAANTHTKTLPGNSNYAGGDMAAVNAEEKTKSSAANTTAISDAVTQAVKETTAKQLTDKKVTTSAPAASTSNGTKKENTSIPVASSTPVADKKITAPSPTVSSTPVVDKKVSTPSPATPSTPNVVKKESTPLPATPSTPNAVKKENIVPAPAAAAPVVQKPVEKPKTKSEPVADVSAAIGKMKDTVKNPAVSSVPPDPEHWKEHRPIRLDLDFGLKAGYEWGFGSYHANSYVISPYLQYKINDKLSVIFQPGYKAAKLNTTDLNDHKSYYQISDSRLDSSIILTTMGINPNTQLSIFGIARKYNYSQSHDSIIISKAIKSKTFYEIELPLLLQYQVIKNLGIYAGASANFSKVAQVQETRVVYSGIVLKDSIQFAAENIPSEPPVIPSVNDKFNYAATPYSQYTPVSSLNATTNPVRFNFILGLNYNVWKRVTADVMLQGNLSNLSYIPDDRIKQIYKTPHFRILIGYRLGK